MSLKKKIIFVFLTLVILPLGIFPVTTLMINYKLISIVKAEINQNDEPQKAVGALAFYNKVFTTYFEDPKKLEGANFYEGLIRTNPELLHISIKLDGDLIYEGTKSNNHSDPPFPQDIIQNSSYTLDLDGKELLIAIDYNPIVSKIPEGKIRDIVALIGLSSIILYLLFSLFFIRWVIKNFLPPIEQLKKIANQITKKDYNIQIDIARKDEIGEAFIAFDQMRQSIQTYEDNRKEFVSSISHDLKTPITAIKGYITAIQEGMANTPEKMDKYVQVILNNTLHMEQLVDDLFLHSKLDVDQVTFDLMEVNFEKYLDYLIDDIKLEFEPQGIQVLWTSPMTSEIKCEIDAVKIKRVIQNVVVNATKHFDKKEKKLKFELFQNDRTVILTIEDNGEGISESDLPNVFQRFYRGDSSRNTATGSTGLGLAICKQIVEKHHGKISVKSDLGVGSMIIIELPCVEGE